MAEMSKQGPWLKGLTYLFSHEAGRKVAHCLDLDLVSSGATIQEAEESLNAIVVIQIESCVNGGNFSQLFFVAPPPFWQHLGEAKPLESALLKVDKPPVVLPVERYERYQGAIPVSRFEMELAVAA